MRRAAGTADDLEIDQEVGSVAEMRRLLRIPVDRDRSFRIDVTEDSEFA